jgi:glycosyltransferase involved in cell wall biosynthesis
MGQLFRSAHVMVSPSLHDGTPNTLLESMACGCFPIAGDLASIREWINSGENGLLIDSTSPSSLARGVLEALSDDDLREQAANLNSVIIQERADYPAVMQRAEGIYRAMQA